MQCKGEKMNRITQIILIFTLLFLATTLTAAELSGTKDCGEQGTVDDKCLDIKYPDIQKWITAGVQGGIPSVTKIKATLNSGDDIQAAVDAGGEGVILLKSGTYLVKKPINMKDGVVIRGESKNDVKINVDILYTATKYEKKSAFVFGSNVEYAGIENLSMDYISAGSTMPKDHAIDDFTSTSKSGIYENNKSNMIVRFVEINGKNCWLDNLYLYRSGSDPVILENNSAHNTLKDLTIDRSYNKGGSGNGYVAIEGDYNLVTGCKITRIRHFSIQLGAKYNVVVNNYFQVDINFHNGDDGHNLIEGNEIKIPAYHSWGIFSAGGRPWNHQSPGEYNIIFNNDTYDYNEKKSEYGGSVNIYTHPYEEYQSNTDPELRYGHLGLKQILTGIPQCGTFYPVVCNILNNNNTDTINTAKTGMRKITSAELVADMGAGWNHGNYFDVTNENKTVWGNPHPTSEQIDMIAAKGFKTMRLPVTWGYNMGGAPDYSIESSYLNSVEEVANYAFKNGMYVIINIHHDEHWIPLEESKAPDTKEQLTKVWTQIANHFKDYGDYLIFETLNEPRTKGSAKEWQGGTAAERAILNEYHQICLNAIRATGGNNTKRQVMISTYAAAFYGGAMEDWEHPKTNGVKDPNIIASLHVYNPYKFSMKDSEPTFTEAHRNQVNSTLNDVKKKFVDDRSVPVVIGEWGSVDNNNELDRAKHAGYYVRVSTELGMATVIWDDGSFPYNGNGGFAIYDRDKNMWHAESVADSIIANVKVKGNVTPTEPDKQTPYTGIPLSLPGIIEAEDYDKGGEGISYHDVETLNKLGEYRTDGVDIEFTGDNQGDYNIGWIASGEWLEYTVEVQKSASYIFNLRHAALEQTGEVSFFLDDSQILSSLVLSPTGNWQEYKNTESRAVHLEAGQYILRVWVDQGGFNLNYIEVIEDAGVPVASLESLENPQILKNGASIQVYDLRGQFMGNFRRKEQLKALGPGVFMIRTGKKYMKLKANVQ